MAKILTVDDTVSMREMLGYILKQAGHEVILAADGEEGLARAADSGVDLVISDVWMPQLDGIAFTRRLRQTAEHRHTPILVVTTDQSQEMKAKARAAGATGWMVKPVLPEQFVATVNKVLA
jgi:two-component system, chemotaxis family, chemotaxis protein CheY